MAELDLKLAEWALGVAKKNGATAAEVLLVSGESLSAGVRLGEVEKLKSSRERRLGLRVFSGQSSATSSTASPAAPSTPAAAAAAARAWRASTSASRHADGSTGSSIAPSCSGPAASSSGRPERWTMPS